MTTHDLDIIVGIFTGSMIAGAIASALWIYHTRRDGLPVPLDDAPFRAVTDADLRLLKICEGCRRYQGNARVISKGQHLNVMLVVCPRCAAHRANVSAGNLQPKSA